MFSTFSERFDIIYDSCMAIAIFSYSFQKTIYKVLMNITCSMLYIALNWIPTISSYIIQLGQES